MGRDPATSVLNGRCQAHEIDNLFVTDGSFMASPACQNPSLTYMAMSARAANYARSDCGRREPVGPTAPHALAGRGDQPSEAEEESIATEGLLPLTLAEASEVLGTGHLGRHQMDG